MYVRYFIFIFLGTWYLDRGVYQVEMKMKSRYHNFLLTSNQGVSPQPSSKDLPLNLGSNSNTALVPSYCR